MRLRLTAGCRFYCTHVELRHTSPSFWPTAFPLLLPRSGKALNPCKVQAAPTVWGSVCQDPHLHVLLRAHLPCFLWPKLEAHPPPSLQRPHFAIFLEQVHVMSFFPAEANCDSASAIAENFANYSVSSTLDLEWSTYLQFLLRL